MGTFRSRMRCDKRDGCQFVFFSFEGKRQSESRSRDHDYS
jgi:hypothetical protein